MIETARRHYLARFGGSNQSAEPFLNFKGAVVLDEGKHTHFMKTGTLTEKDLKGAYSFAAGLWIHERWIIQAIEIATPESGEKDGE